MPKTTQKAECSSKQRSVPLRGKESSLHHSLKFHYTGAGGVIEAQVGPYVCDGLTSSGEIIEVQTGSLGPIKEKVFFLAKNGKVRIIHPIVNHKYIELFDSGGNFLHSRKSPRKGKTWDLFKSLVYAPELALLKNTTIELAVIDIREKRISDGSGSWWRKGVRVADRFLETWHSSVVLSRRSDYCNFIPFKKNESFTAREFAKNAGINARLAGKTLYVLTKIGLVEKTGKQGNTFIYKRARS